MPSLRSPPAPEAPKESVVSRLLIAPLTFISFILSLALIDTRNTSLRTQQRSIPGPQPTTLTGRIGTSFQNLLFKPVSSASPYAYIEAPDAKSGTATKSRNDEPWHWHTKQRQQMKAEISDAFAVRIWVLYALLGCALSSLVGAWVMGRWVLGFVKGWL